MFSGCIYIDDAGNPGTESGSDYLSSSRKSWTAVIVPTSIAKAVEMSMELFLKGVKNEFGASELHFTDIYSGRGIWKEVAIDKRIEIFDLMKNILESFSLPIVHQTASEETIHENKNVFANWVKSPTSRWDIHDVSHLGFLKLCSNLSRHIQKLQKQDPKDFKLPLPLVVDEGIAKAGARLDLPNWGSVISGQKAQFSNSKDTPGIQIADFAAFVISRTQWIMAKQEQESSIKRGDLAFLKLTTGLNILNLPELPFWSNHISKQAYESALDEDRRIKGLQVRTTDST